MPDAVCCHAATPTTLSNATFACCTACPGLEPGFFTSCTLTRSAPPFSYTLNLRGCRCTACRSAVNVSLWKKPCFCSVKGDGSVRGYQTIRTSMR